MLRKMNNRMLNNSRGEGRGIKFFVINDALEIMI